MRSKH